VNSLGPEVGTIRVSGWDKRRPRDASLTHLLTRVVLTPITRMPLDHQSSQGDTQRERILARYFNVTSIKGDNRQLVKRFLLGALWAAVVTPLLFYLRCGTLNWFSISFTIFLIALCLLFALGFFFQTKTEYHTQVPMEGSLADRIGAFWLIACAFGPFFGWIITAFPPGETSWKWQYGARAFLSVILPVITAVPLVPYARGKSALIAIPLLLVITALPVWSCFWVLGDLHDGPETANSNATVIVSIGDPTREIETTMRESPCSISRPGFTVRRTKILWLKHTQRVLQREDLKC